MVKKTAQSVFTIRNAPKNSKCCTIVTKIREVREHVFAIKYGLSTKANARIKFGVKDLCEHESSKFWSHVTFTDVFGHSLWRWQRECQNICNYCNTGKEKERKKTGKPEQSPKVIWQTFQVDTD